MTDTTIGKNALFFVVMVSVAMFFHKVRYLLLALLLGLVYGGLWQYGATISGYTIGTLGLMLLAGAVYHLRVRRRLGRQLYDAEQRAKMFAAWYQKELEGKPKKTKPGFVPADLSHD